MKKFLVLAALAGVLVASVVGPAEARRVLRRQELGWLTPNSAVPNGAFQVSYTPKPLASGTLDTTGVFSLQNADWTGYGNAVDNFSAQDSVIVGYLVCFSDSTADGASTLTAATATFDASMDGNDWAVAGTAALVAASDDPVVAVPIVQRAGIDHQNLFALARQLRVRFTAATGYLLACRVKVMWWAEDGN